MTQRMDMVTAVTRLLLDNSTFSEAVTLQRCARLLAGEIADWVIIDMERGGQLRRQFATGAARSGHADQLARTARGVDPEPESVPWQVHAAGKSVLLAHVDDPGALGAGPDGTPLLMMLGAASLICVPISDGTDGYGTLTLARQAGSGPFGVADLGLAEELGQHLADRDPGRPDVPAPLGGGRDAAGQPAARPAARQRARPGVRVGLHRRHAVAGDQRGLLRRVQVAATAGPSR